MSREIRFNLALGEALRCVRITLRRPTDRLP